MTSKTTKKNKTTKTDTKTISKAEAISEETRGEVNREYRYLAGQHMVSYPKDTILLDLPWQTVPYFAQKFEVTSERQAVAHINSMGKTAAVIRRYSTYRYLATKRNLDTIDAIYTAWGTEKDLHPGDVVMVRKDDKVYCFGGYAKQLHADVVEAHEIQLYDSYAVMPYTSFDYALETVLMKGIPVTVVSETLDIRFLCGELASIDGGVALYQKWFEAKRYSDVVTLVRVGDALATYNEDAKEIADLSDEYGLPTLLKANQLLIDSICWHKLLTFLIERELEVDVVESTHTVHYRKDHMTSTLHKDAKKAIKEAPKSANTGKGSATTKKTTKKTTKSTSASVSTPTCLCGCGGITKGGKFLPGHDAKAKGMLRRVQEGKLEASAISEALREYANSTPSWGVFRVK